MSILVEYFVNWIVSATLFVCPIVIYILIFKQPIRKKLHGHYYVPGWNFHLKRLWAYFRLILIHGYNNRIPVDEHWKPVPTQEDLILEGNHKLNDRKSVDSLYICGTDHKGNSLYLKFVKRRQHVADVWLHVHLNGGAVYQLLDHPNSVVFNVSSKVWSAKGLKLCILEPFKRWRITFNGLMRKSYLHWEDGQINEKKEIDHIIFNFIWKACSRKVDSNKVYSPNLLSEALAREPWRDADWNNSIDILESGYDQFGVFHGKWKESNGLETELYLRGLRQRRWGLDQALWLHRSITFSGVDNSGLMFTITASSSFYGPTQLIFGHVVEAVGVQVLIDSCDLSLPDLAESKVIPRTVVFRFTAGGKNYTVVANFVSRSDAKLYGGYPWNYEVHTRTFQFSINANQGSGIAQFFYRYRGECNLTLPSDFPILPEPKVKNYPLATTFKDQECRSSAVVGGKGASLAQLSAAESNKWKVPPGFCLSVAAFNEQVRHFVQLQDAIKIINDITTGRNKVSLKEYCDKAVDLFETTPICEPVKRALQDMLQEMDLTGPWAVRSSAVGEDSEELSAAGQNSTVLGVKNEEDLYNAVKKCWGSLYTFQSVQYRRQNGQLVESAMGVVIQQMVHAQSAGVLFTRHPVTGDARQILITSNYGLGESVVSALVDPDTVILERMTEHELTIKESVCGKKEHKVTMADNGGVITESLASIESSRISITEEQCLSLGYLGLDVEKYFGHARDIEWAIFEGCIYLLQARPITSLDTWTDFELLHELDTPYVYDHEITSTANLGEVFPGATSPLTQSTVVPVINFTGEEGCTGQQTNNLYMVHTSHNHLLINMLNSHLNAPDEKLTVLNKVTEIAVYGHIVVTPEMHRFAVQRNGIASSGRKLRTLLRFIQVGFRNKKNVEQAEKCVRDFNIDFTTSNSSLACYDKITQSLPQFEKIATYHTESSSTSVFTEFILFMLLLEGKEDFSLEHYNDISLLLSSCTDIISAEVPLALKEIATAISNSNHAEEFCALSPETAPEWLQHNCTDASRKLQDFLSRHGHRGLREFDFKTETWGINPTTVISTLQSFVKAPQDNNKAKQIVNVNDTIKKLISPQKSLTRFFLKCLLPICRTSVRRRETTKAVFIKFVNFFRMGYRHLAKLMVSEGFIPEEKLIYFLTHYEIGQILNSRDPVIVKKAIRRCKHWPEWDKLQFPEILIGFPQPIKENLTSNADTLERVQGTPVYPGTVVGRACVILTLDEISQLQQGDILITYSTDIGWSPYFPILGGVVTEIGGLISHGAVVAREYGLPCIVGAQSATTVFKTGDTVLLIGSNGTVDKIRKEEDYSENISK